MYRFFWGYLLVTSALLSGGTNVSAETWAERLGFPPGRRVVILDSREVGISWEMNEAAKDLLKDGKLSSVGAIVTGPWFEDFAGWTKEHPDYDIGINIALTNPYSTPTWRLLTSEMGHTTLVDAHGQPWKTVVQLVSHATPEDVKEEIDAQIREAQRAGIKPTHIASFYGTAFTRVDLAAVILGAAKKYWIPASVVELTPELAEFFRQEGYPVDRQMMQLIADYPLPKLDDLQWSPPADTYEAKKAAYIALLKSLKPGLTNIILQPAIESRGLQLVNENGQQHAWDAQMLADPQVVEVMKQEQIIVTNWREIMERFEGVKPFVLDESESGQE